MIACKRAISWRRKEIPHLATAGDLGSYGGGGEGGLTAWGTLRGVS